MNDLVLWREPIRICNTTGCTSIASYGSEYCRQHWGGFAPLISDLLGAVATGGGLTPARGTEELDHGRDSERVTDET